MKKKILSLAIVAISLVAFSSNAQTPAANNNNRSAKTCQNDKNKKDNHCKHANPFEGLNLTATQQAQLDQLNANRESARAERMKSEKADRQKSDSSRIANRRAAKKKYLEDVKAIIGPEQYVVFLENIVVNSGNDKAMSHKQHQGKKNDNKNRKDRQKGNRNGAQRQGQQASAATNL